MKKKTLLDRVKQIVVEEVMVNNDQEQIDSHLDPEQYLFDFRRILMNGKHADIISELFYETFKDQYPFQLCSLEIGGVPLVTSLMNKFYQKGHADINAFFIRKSRKKSGLLRMVEGTIQEEKKIIIVDDLCNSGSSLWRQVTVLEELGYTVHTAWTILRFYDMDYYKRFKKRGIVLSAAMSQDDLSYLTQGKTKNIPSHKPFPASNQPFQSSWLFRSHKPNLQLVVPKSQPTIDEDTIYVGSDHGKLYAINQTDGSVKWSFTIGYFTHNKGIFSSPILHNNTVIFGGYDGNIYCLDKNNGNTIWVNRAADFIGSSPEINPKDNLVYLGVEMAVPHKQGGLIAINCITGKTVWADYNHWALTHASPLYIAEHNMVVIGSNEGTIYAYHATNGTLLWRQQTYGGLDYHSDRDHGFGWGSIKLRPAYYPKKDYIICCSIDRHLYILESNTGHIVHAHRSGYGCWSTPLIYKNRVYWTSEDKHLRCLNLLNFKLEWSICPDNTRLFSSPIIYKNLLYLGTNAARMHEIDPITGQQLSYFQALERITNSPIGNLLTNTIFLPTYANEIIALHKKEK